MKISLLRYVFVRYRKILFSMLMIAALCCGLVTGLMNVRLSQIATFDAYEAVYGIADAVISTRVTEDGAAETLLAVPGVAQAETRLTGVVQFTTPAGQLLSAYVSTLDGEEIQRLHRWIELPDAAEDYVLLEDRFARDNGIAIGDEILVSVNGEDRPFQVAALVSAPETIAGARMAGIGGYYSDIGYLYAPVSLLARETEKEYGRMLAEWERQEETYRQAEREAAQARAEGEQALADARRELAGREAEFGQSRDALKEQLSALTEARIQLMLGQRDLTQAEATAQERGEQLGEALALMQGQLIDVEDKQAELEEIRNDLNSLLVRLEDAKGRLAVARGRIEGTEDDLYATLYLLRQARTAWKAAAAADPGANLPGIVGGQVNMTFAEIEERLRQKGITLDTLNERIRQTEAGVGKLADGKVMIQAGIEEINQTYLPEILRYLEETEQGLEVVAEAEEGLKDGITQAEGGLEAVEAFMQKTPDSRAALDQQLAEVEDYIRTIYDAIAQGEAALAEGRAQLQEKSGEAEAALRETEAQLAQGAEALADALDELNAWPGYTPLRNEFLLSFAPEVTDREAVLAQAAAALGDVVTGSVLYEDSYVSSRIRDHMDSWEVMAVFTPACMTVLVVLALFLFLSMMVRQSRREIAVLRALGFSQGAVRGLFCMACLLTMIPAMLLGAAVSRPVQNVFSGIYQKIYNFPLYVTVFDRQGFALVAGAMLAATLAAALVGTAAVNQVEPAEIMSRQANRTRPMSPRFSRILNRLSPLSKVSLLSLRRNPLRFFSSVLCIGAAAALIFTAMSFLTTLDHIETEIFENRIHYDCQALFSAPPDAALEEEIRGLPGVEALETAWNYTAALTFGDQKVSVSLTALPPDAALLTIPDAQGRPMEAPERGVVLPDAEREPLGVRVGDIVMVNGVPLEVAAFSRQTGNPCAYVSTAQAAALGEPEQYAWLLRLDREEEGAAQAITARLNREDDCLITVVTDVLRRSFAEYMQETSVFSWILLGFASALGFFITLNTHQANMLEMKKEMSILRAMGFQKRAISLRWYLQSLLYFVCSLGAGLPAGWLIAAQSFERLSNSSLRFTYVGDPFQFAVTAGMLFAFLTGAHLWSMRAMGKWNLAENVRDKE